MGYRLHHSALASDRRRATLVAVLGLLLGGALGLMLLGGAVGVSRSSAAASSDQTHPLVRPHRGHAQATFSLALTPQHNLGVSGVIKSDYRILVTGPASTCGSTLDISQGTKGQRVHEPLKPPSPAGWCVGRYRGQVLYEQGPFCPPGPVARPCPLFATQELDAGHFRFRVLSSSRHRRRHHGHHG